MISRDDEIILNFYSSYVPISENSSYHCRMRLGRLEPKSNKSISDFDSSFELKYVKKHYLSLERSLRDRDFDLDRDRLRLVGDSDESYFERCDFFLLVDDFFSFVRVSLDEIFFGLSFEFFGFTVRLDDDDDVFSRS